MRENYYLDDGTYSASQIVILMVKRALEGMPKDVGAAVLKDLREPVESVEFRLKIKVPPCPLHTYLSKLSGFRVHCFLCWPRLGQKYYYSNRTRVRPAPSSACTAYRVPAHVALHQ